MKRPFTLLGSCALWCAYLANPSLADCMAPETGDPHAWLPSTPFPSYAEPLPHNQPDCPFYVAAWQTFLYVTRPDADGNPAFLRYPQIRTVLAPWATGGRASEASAVLDLEPRKMEMANDPENLVAAVGPEIAAGIEQAQLGGVLIDQAGNPIYYAIHFNYHFADFLERHDLLTKDAILRANESLSFDEPGIVEMKSAWKILTNADDRSAYIWKEATVPKLVVSDGKVAVDPGGGTRTVDVALLALHVAFTMEGHPEFVWSTFEHVDKAGNPDSAPSATANPGDTDPEFIADANASYPLYRAGTPAKEANLDGMIAANALAATFDEPTQTFTRNAGAAESVFRAYPASKQSTTERDEDVDALNDSVRKRFADQAAPDPRQNYKLVGAVWLDRPGETFMVGKAFANAAGQSSDEGPVAGEDGMSSTAMESFTQKAFPSCFSCHDTRAVRTSTFDKIIDAKALNVSHVLSRFLSGGE